MTKIRRRVIYAHELDILIYKEPKCDFEHIWNVALDKVSECIIEEEIDEKKRVVIT